MAAVLGVKLLGHDTGAAIIDGDRIVAIAEERLTRIKHAPGTFPAQSIAYCLETLNLTPQDIALVVADSTVEGKRGVGTERHFFHEKTSGRFTHASFLSVNHHDAHAASAFFCSPFSEAAILVYDGIGSRLTTPLGVSGVETESLYVGKDNEITRISKSLHLRQSSSFPNTFGIGMLYTLLSREYLQFGAGNEGKMMGLAAYGDDALLKEFPIERWVREYEGTLMCNPHIRFSRPLQVRTRMRRGAMRLIRLGIGYTRFRAQKALGRFRFALARALAPAVVDPKIFTPITMPFPARAKDHPLPDPRYSAVAYAAQRIFEHFSASLATHLRLISGQDRLCVSGGCALNIDANRNFLTQAGFSDLYVQPASSDCGIPLGCALWGKHMSLKEPRSWVMRNASLGREYADVEIDAAIAARDSEIEYHVSKNLAQETAELIAGGHIIGWFQGGSEYGPRALGNRSILCDARDPKMKDTLNARVKHRELWRPFACSILAEHLTDYFDLAPNSATSFMLLCGEVHRDKRALVPSIVHIDNTCRMQTLTKEHNGVYYDLVSAFNALTGVPLLLNTSFNLAGDPIVETPADALDTFLRTDMDYLVLSDRIIKKRARAR